MPLQKQSLAIPFSTGIDQKTDPLQVSPMNLLSLKNCIYTKDKRLTKRNGFANLSALPDGVDPIAITTFKDNLEIIGNSILAYDNSAEAWIDRGRYQACEVSVVSSSRSSESKDLLDSVSSSDGKTLICFREGDGTLYYQIADSLTSQVLLGPVALAASTTAAKAFLVGNIFIVLYLVNVAATPTLRYIAIPQNTLIAQSPVTVSSQVDSLAAGFDGYVYEDVLYMVWSGSDVGGSVRLRRLDSNLNFFLVTVIATGSDADYISVTVDAQGAWTTWYQDSDTSVRSVVTQYNGVNILPETSIDSSSELVQLTTLVNSSGVLEIFGEVTNDYSFASVRSDYINKYTMTIAGTVVGPTIILRSVGLASKPFLYMDSVYFLCAYDSELQPTYFLSDSQGYVIAKLAYSNGGGYVNGQVLSSATVLGTDVYIAYQIKDLLVSVSKSGGPDDSNIYTQTGVNIAIFNMDPQRVSTAEIGNNLHISGGYVWMYDGNLCTEHNFHLWPDNIAFTPATSGGNMADQIYQYHITYEWTDAQGNIHRSAPSVPENVIVSGGSGNGSVVIDIPTLRLTTKPDIRIVVYRWSAGQQSFYQVSSITSPLLNDPDVDSVQYTDTASDASILGNPLIYTTGGVVENIAYPASTSLALYKSRLMVLSSEDPNVVWYSKQVVQGVPAEPSDLFTLFIAPTTGAQGSTGPTKVLSAMDDKFLLYKDDAIYYIVGTGPDNTGAQNDFSEPIFIAGTVGCDNQNSIAMIPQGQMFGSDKGIWLLGRDLSTTYIGAQVEDFNARTIVSATVIPNTNEVRFCLDGGEALMYDYYFARWATFDNIPSIASTLFEQKHTYLTTELEGSIVRQETPGEYLDGSSPVLISYETAWMNLAGLQGLERVYFMYLLGTFISPHKLSISIYYDYQEDFAQSVLITPDNYAGQYATNPNFYAQVGVYAGEGSLEQWQVFFNKQKLQSVKIRLQEFYDASQGGFPGEGLTLSGMNFVVGVKKPYPTLRASRRVG